MISLTVPIIQEIRTEKTANHAGLDEYLNKVRINIAESSRFAHFSCTFGENVVCSECKKVAVADTTTKLKYVA